MTSYPQTFEVSIGRLSVTPDDLSMFCLKTYSPEKKEFEPDTVDDV
ncbi:DUF4354 family protein [Enterobacter pseudoroggenkampii]